MDSEEELSLDHVIVEEVPNSQIQNSALEYNPFISQTLSQAGPSNHPTQSAIQSQSTAESTSDKKRLGRPPKNMHLKPTRGSRRQRKCTTVFNYESIDGSSGQWSERDKQLFLTGCLKVGIEDIDGLKRFLPHKTKDDIRSQIGMWKDLASRNVETQLLIDETSKTPSANTSSVRNLNEWIDYFKEKAKASNASTFVFSNIFLFIAEYGSFPSPEDCGGIDVRGMYRYIHCMMNGTTPYGLNRVTSRTLLTCIDNVMEKLSDPRLIENMEEHLFSFSVTSDKFNEKFGKSYSREGASASSKGIDQILKNPVLNPLNLPEYAILNPDLQLEDDDDDDDSD